MATHTSYLQNAEHSAQSDRLLVAALFGAPLGAFTGALGDTSPYGGHGVVKPSALAVTPGSGMSVEVAPGSCFIRGSQTGLSANQGSYGVTSDAVETLTIEAAHGTYTRADLVVLRVRDSFYDGTDDDSVFEVITGTPAMFPTLPAVPENAIALARVTVPAAVTSIISGNIIDLRYRAYPEGAIGVFTSASRPVNATKGQVIFESDTGNIMVYYGSTTGWRPPWNTAWGLLGGAGSTSDAAVNNAQANMQTPITVPVVAGRRYRVYGSARVSFNSTSVCHYSMSQTGVVLTSKYPDFLAGVSGDSAKPWQLVKFDIICTAASTGNTAIAGSIWSAGGVVTVVTGASIFIEDVGPDTAPA